MSDTEQRWKHDSARGVAADNLDRSPPHTPGMFRKTAINHARAGAQTIWARMVRIGADARFGVHHHGGLRSVIDVEPFKQSDEVYLADAIHKHSHG